MKQKDLTLVIVVVFFAVIVSLIAGKFILGGVKVGEEEVPKVDAITTTFEFPSSKYFNDDSLNPTESVKVTPNDNETPFGS